MLIYLSAATVAICAVSVSHAATLTAQINTSSGYVGFDPTGSFPVPIVSVDRSDVRQSPDPAVTSGAGSASGEFGAAGGAAEASANASTGELKVFALAERSGERSGSAGGTEGTASAYAEIRQDFVVNGTGFITSNLLVDVFWGGVGQRNFDARTVFFGGGSGSDGFAFGELGPSSGRIDDRPITATSFMQNAQDTPVTIVWSLSASVASGSVGLANALLDARNTGTISFSAFEGLSVVPTTPDFLDDASYPSDVAPVPLPASGLLLLGGLGVAAALRRRNRARAIG